MQRPCIGLSIAMILISNACEGDGANQLDDEETGDTDSDVENDDDSTAGGDADSDSGSDPDTDSEEAGVPPDPAAAGPCSTTSFEVAVPSFAYGYSIPAVVYAPTDGLDGPYPIVVIAHGYQLDHMLYASTAARLASWGYVAVLCGYTAKLVPQTPNEQSMRDIMDVLEAITSGGVDGLDGVVDDTRTAILGHSMGGKLGLMIAGEHPELVDTVVGFDPVQGVNASMGPVSPSVSEIEVPVLMLGETFSANNAVMGVPCAPPGLNYQTFYDALPAGLPTLEITFAHAFHMSWLDNPACGPTCSACPSDPEADDDAVLRSSWRYAISWLEMTLRGADEYDYYLRGDGMAEDIAAGTVTAREK